MYLNLHSDVQALLINKHTEEMIYEVSHLRNLVGRLSCCAQVNVYMCVCVSVCAGQEVGRGVGRGGRGKER
jgi:hypothetical protein